MHTNECPLLPARTNDSTGENPYFDVRKEREIVMPKEQARRAAIQKTIKEENARRKELESKEAAYLARCV